MADSSTFVYPPKRSRLARGATATFPRSAPNEGPATTDTS